jgi:hypothetical protein
MKSFIRLSIAFVLFSVSFLPFVRAQYCLLPGRTPYSTLQPGIIHFKLNTIDRSSANVEDMSKVVVVTSDTTTVYPGQTYTVTLAHTRDTLYFPTARNNIRVWVDYNRNGSFDDAGEKVISADFKTFGTFTDTFKIPASAALGVVRLRATAKMSSDAGHSIPTPCDSPVADPIGYHGEMEDYFLRIATPPTKVADIASVAPVLTVYPNPANGYVTLAFDKVIEEPVSVDLLDITGKSLVRLLDAQKLASPSFSFDINQYAHSAGVYILRVAGSGGTSFQRIIKEN